MKKIFLLIAFVCMFSVQAFANNTFVDTPTWDTDPSSTANMVRPMILFTRNFQYTYTPAGGTETTVNAIEISGNNLYISNPGGTIHTIPILKLGGYEGTSLTVLAQGSLANDPTKKHVIALLPNGTLAGTHALWVHTFASGGNFLRGGVASATSVTIGQIGPQGIQGLKGNTGAPGPSGSTNVKKWVFFNGRPATPVKIASHGIGTITRSGHQYTINFSPAFANRNYVVVDSTSNGHCFNREQSASRLVIYCLNTSGQATVADRINLLFVK